ncbi:MAG: DUF11 domain-containing protein [Micropruina sp.]|uniref:DUF7927 domain-containing protein n=1 Tax=Micropruina sp. TaxID=2737536 RepID=UPI0039E2A3E2
MALILGFLLTIVMVAIPVSRADAAGNGVLNVALTPIDVADGSTISSLRNGEHDNQITYRVSYSCTTDTCADASIAFAPSQPDPHGLLPAGRYLLSWTSWVAPSGATISGTDATGKVVRLGDLSPGTSNTFTMTYTVEPNRFRGISASQFYPDGFDIEMSAEISSPSAVAPVRANAADVTWRIDLPTPAQGPLVAVGAAASVRTDEDVRYTLTMSAGNMYAGGGANITGNASLLAAGNYQVVYHVPSQAEIVSADFGGVVDQAAHTVTWTTGSASSPVFGARGGWGLNAASGFNGSGNAADNVAGADNFARWGARTVVVRYPGGNFPEADANGCNFATNVTSRLDVSVSYLDSARTTRTTSATRTNQVACQNPFGKMRIEKTVPGGANGQYSGGDGDVGGGVYAANIPRPGEPDRTAMGWRVGLGNQSNVPAVFVVDEPNLDKDHLHVDQVTSSGAGATFEWTASNGASGTATRNTGQALAAPAGAWFVSIKTTTTPVAPGRVQQTDSGETMAYLVYRFRIPADAPLGETRTNTAQVTMTFPGNEAVLAPLTGTVSRTIQFTRTSPALGAGFVGTPTVIGGGSLTPGKEVSYTMRGATDAVWPGTTIVPQIAFIAPVGWQIVPGSAQLAAGAPAGVTFSYVTKTISGVSRQVVLATWPGPITPSATGQELWPDLTVRATPTPSAPTGNNAAVALVRISDASGTWVNPTGAGFQTTTRQFRASPAAVVDNEDVDGDGITAEGGAQASSTGVTVAAASGIKVVKEICRPDASAGDGCAWESVQPHYLPITAGQVKYRLTVTNPGNTTLTGVAAYDVLPHVGDTGLLAGAAPRGSQFELTLQSVDSVDAGVSVAYSTSTNPARPEVNPGATGTVDDWGTGPAGKRALRMKLDSALAPGGSKSMTFTATIAAGAAVDQKACNSVAVGSSQTLPTEPQAVCATLAEADLAVELTSLSGIQAGRPAQFTFAVTNRGRSAESPATTRFGIPDGISVTSLMVPGWDCTVLGGGSAPVAGPATLSCQAVTVGGTARTLARDATESLTFPVQLSPDALASVADPSQPQLCLTGSVTGPLYDPVLGNNQAGGCRPLAAPGGLAIAKDDGIFVTKVGAEYSYTITVRNTLLAETVTGATVRDVLPASLDFVPADGTTDRTEDGGTLNGRTVTWQLGDLAPGAETTVQVRVRVTGAATSPLVNTATVSAPDPGDPSATLIDSDSDADEVRSLSIAKTSNAPVNPRPGDTVTYTVTLSNDGPGDYTAGQPASLSDDLTRVLDDAGYNADVLASAGPAPTVSNGRLTWSGPLAAGDHVDITYSVTLRAGGDGSIVNRACVPAPEASTDGDGCAEVSFGIALVSATKSVNPASGTAVHAGDTITYTLTFVNSGTAAGPVQQVDDLTHVLDDAQLAKAPTASDPGLIVGGSGNRVSITGMLAAGATETVSYTVVVLPDGQRGDDVMANFLLTPDGQVPDQPVCAIGDGPGLCTVNRVVDGPDVPVTPPPANQLPQTGVSTPLLGMVAALLAALAGAVLIVVGRRSAR